MLLMDAIASTAHLVLMRRVADSPFLSGFPDLHRKLYGTPRFLFDNPAIATAVELTLGRPKVLRETMANIRIPYTRMWVEWEEAGREELRRRLKNDNGLPLPLRVGFLLECEDGRRGTITWLWTSSATEKLRVGKMDMPCLAPFVAYFDLDADIAQPVYYTQSLIRANIGAAWHNHPVQLDALESIWRTAEHKPSPWGERYLREVYYRGLAGDDVNHYQKTTSDEDFARFVAVQLEDVYGEYIQAWATLIMLTASRPIIERASVSMAKLNKLRAKKNEPLLYDHTRVSLHLNHRPQGPVIARGPLGYARKPPRIHMVSSYLARRGDLHWIVQPYMRGRGETIHRVTRVTP